MSVAANGPQTDCAWSCAAENARHAGEAPRVRPEALRRISNQCNPSTAVTAPGGGVAPRYRDLKDLKKPDSN